VLASHSAPQLDPRLQVLLIVVPVAALLINACAFCLNAYQMRRANLQNRAGHVAAALKEFTNDAEAQHAFYLVEYSKFKYTKAFHGSETERDVDKVLRLLSNVALLWEAGLLSTDNVIPLKYYYLRVYWDSDIQLYLEFMANWTREAEVHHHPYASFSRLALALEGQSPRGNRVPAVGGA